MDFLTIYTVDKGNTYNPIIISAKSCTEAYLKATLKIPKNSEITGLFYLAKEQEMKNTLKRINGKFYVNKIEFLTLTEALTYIWETKGA